MSTITGVILPGFLFRVALRNRIWFVVLLLATCVPGVAQDRIILRNLDTLTPESIARMDVDGVLLGDGMLVPWDRIETGIIGGGKQVEFDRLLADLGPHLFRIRQRLVTGDDEGILEHAEAVYPRYAQRRSPTAFMVFQGLVWSRIAVGRREDAVAPYLECLDYLSHAGDSPPLPGSRRMAWDKESGISRELVPVWFNAEAAQRALPRVLEVVKGMREPKPDGARIYYATLALTAGDEAAADQALDGLDGLPAWRQVVEVQREVLGGRMGPASLQLESEMPRRAPDLRASALYWIGRARMLDTDRPSREAALLHLLKIAAVEGQRQPELSAAGLYQAIEVLDQMGDTRGAIAVRRELLERYGGTDHAARVNHNPDPNRK